MLCKFNHPNQSTLVTFMESPSVANLDVYLICFWCQKLRSITTFAAVSIALIFVWKYLRAPPEHQRRQSRRRNLVSAPSGSRLHSDTTFSSSEVCSSSGDTRALDAVDEFFRPVKVLVTLYFNILCLILSARVLRLVKFSFPADSRATYQT